MACSGTVGSGQPNLLRAGWWDHRNPPASSPFPQDGGAITAGRGAPGSRAGAALDGLDQTIASAPSPPLGVVNLLISSKWLLSFEPHPSKNSDTLKYSRQ